MPAERLMLTVSIVCAALNCLLIVLKQADIDYLSYLSLSTMIAGLMALGLFYRMSGRDQRIAAAVLCAAIFLFFSMCLSLYTYLLLPLTGPTIDPYLVAVDAFFGFHWPTVMEMAADYPVFSDILKWAYLSTIPQFALLIILLGLGGKFDDLYILLTSVAITATLTICFWGVVPSLGTSFVYALPEDVWTAISPVVGQDYGNYLRDTAANGPGEISPREIRGLIAFPSYHAVLAFTAIYAARRIRFIGPVFLVINLLIIPGIFVHGGHHLADLPAGFVLFAAGTVLATRLVTKAGKETKARPVVTA